MLVLWSRFFELGRPQESIGGALRSIVPGGAAGLLLRTKLVNGREEE